MNAPSRGAGQRGFALMMAVVLLLLIGALSTVMSRMALSSSQSAALALQHERALSAARSGIAWAKYQVLSTGTCVNQTFDLSGVAMESFEVTISCSATVHRVGDGDVRQYLLTSESHAGDFGSASFVARRVEALINDG